MSDTPALSDMTDRPQWHVAMRPRGRGGPGIAREDEQHDRDQYPQHARRERGERPGRDPDGGHEGRDDRRRQEPRGEDGDEVVPRALLLCAYLQLSRVA